MPGIASTPATSPRVVALASGDSYTLEERRAFQLQADSLIGTIGRKEAEHEQAAQAKIAQAEREVADAASKQAQLATLNELLAKAKAADTDSRVIDLLRQKIKDLT